MSRRLAAALLLLPGLALAQADVGLVDRVSGEAVFAPRSGIGGKVSAFMKVREGDRFDLKRGAELRLVYFQSARQERWQGPATFRAGTKEGAALAGAPATVVMLPPNVPLQLARVPELVRNAKLGGVQVRTPLAGPQAPRETLEEAKATYEKLRREAQPGDVIPELYLFSVLSDRKLYDDMVPLVARMRSKQPANEEIKALEIWLENVKKR